jgi:hypothetical protein
MEQIRLTFFIKFRLLFFNPGFPGVDGNKTPSYGLYRPDQVLPHVPRQQISRGARGHAGLDDFRGVFRAENEEFHPGSVVPEEGRHAGPSGDRKRQIRDDEIRPEVLHGVEKRGLLRHHDHGFKHRLHQIPDPFHHPGVSIA